MWRLLGALLGGALLTLAYWEVRVLTPGVGATLNWMDFTISILPALVSRATFHAGGRRALFWIGVGLEFTVVAYVALTFVVWVSPGRGNRER